MPWNNTPEKRAQDAKTYGAGWRRVRALAIRRSGGQCEMPLGNGRPCGSKDRVQVDHITPVSQGGTDHLDNLRVLCRAHHQQKTAQEGKGYRRNSRGGGWRKRKAEDPPLATRTKW